MGKRAVTEVSEAASATTLLGPPVAAIVPISQATDAAIVRPVVTAEEAETRWREYIAICKAVLDPSDYIYYACGKKPDGYDIKPFAFRTRAGAEEQLAAWKKFKFTELLVRETKKRSAWDKLARFYGIDTPIESEALCTIGEVVQVGAFIVEKLMGDSFKIFVYQEAETLSVKKVTVLLRVVSPNGRTIIGDGACSVSERSKGADSFAHPDHDVFSTAFTRAFNRGVSRCIGTGEVSAEEFEADTTSAEPPAVESAPSQQVSSVAPEKTTANDGTPLPQAGTAPPPQPPATAATPQGPPRAEIPTELPTGRQATLPATEAVAQQPSPGVADQAKFATLGETATLPQRIEHIKAFLFGKKDADDRLVEYLFFSVSPIIRDPVEIESNGRWHPAKWNAAMRALEDRKARMGAMEEMLAKEGRESFVVLANALIEAARARKIFGRK